MTSLSSKWLIMPWTMLTDRPCDWGNNEMLKHRSDDFITNSLACIWAQNQIFSFVYETCSINWENPLKNAFNSKAAFSYLLFIFRAIAQNWAAPYYFRARNAIKICFSVGISHFCHVHEPQSISLFVYYHYYCYFHMTVDSNSRTSTLAIAYVAPIRPITYLT